MNVTMMELVRLCVNVNAKRDSQQLLTSSGSGKDIFAQGKERIFIDFDVQYFWKWTEYEAHTVFNINLNYKTFLPFISYWPILHYQ